MNQTDQQPAWEETLKQLRESQDNLSQEGWIDELAYGLRNLYVGDEEQMRIEGMIENQRTRIRDQLQWTFDLLGYDAAYILFIQWICLDPLKDLKLKDIRKGLLHWRCQWNLEYIEDGDTWDPEVEGTSTPLWGAKIEVQAYLDLLHEYMNVCDRGQSPLNWELLDRSINQKPGLREEIDHIVRELAEPPIRPEEGTLFNPQQSV